MHVGDGGGQDFDLNLAPIIDCFTVLITYLLVSASFLSLSIFDIGVAASGQGAAANPTTPPHAVIVRMTESRSIELRVSGGAENLSLTIPIASVSADWNFVGVNTKLDQLKQKYSDINDVSLSAENHVTYKEVIRVIEALRKTNPKIYLAT
jgi:biopolymer transport protein ExbD